MSAAMSIMTKMLKNKDNGKFCIILILTITLGLLMFFVFS